MKTNLNWSTGNSKLKKLNTASFNLPAFKSADGFKVCPKAGQCAAFCYARQGRYIMPSVQKPREENLKLARGHKGRFIRMAIQDLTGPLKKFKTIRIHDSGDFFSQAYYNAWVRIAAKFPDRIFYAYTKSLHLDLYTHKPKNLRIIQSVGGQLDAQIDLRKPHSRVFVDHKARRRARYVDGNVNDGPAIKGLVKIGLVYHGVKNLTEGQKRGLQ